VPQPRGVRITRIEYATRSRADSSRTVRWNAQPGSRASAASSLESRYPSIARSPSEKSARIDVGPHVVPLTCSFWKYIFLDAVLHGPAVDSEKKGTGGA
jgi:hypothetical protein